MHDNIFLTAWNWYALKYENNDCQVLANTTIPNVWFILHVCKNKRHTPFIITFFPSLLGSMNTQ